MNLKCKNCFHWKIITDDFENTGRDTVEITGKCRRYPPTVISNIGFGSPDTGSEFYCGEWKEKVSKPSQKHSTKSTAYKCDSR